MGGWIDGWIDGWIMVGGWENETSHKPGSRFQMCVFPGPGELEPGAPGVWKANPNLA